MTALKYYVEKLRIPVTSRNRDKQTAAHIAAGNENLSILKYLLEEDDSVLEFSDINGNTILHVAVENGSLDMVKYLVDEAHANSTAVNKIQSNNTPLHIAAENGHLDVLKYLVTEKKADVDARNEAGETAIFLAAEKPHIDVVKYMAEEAKANLTVTDDKNENILFVSARVGDLQVPKYLLETIKVDLDINWKDALGYTLAHTAARFNKLECLKYFVERGADIEIDNEAGWTPLHEAASGGHMEVVEYLLKNGANATSKNKFGRTPFHVASDKKVKKYLREAVPRRDRRNVLSKPFFPASAMSISSADKTQISESFANRLHVIEGKPVGNVEPNTFHIQNFLVFANTITKYRQAATAFSHTPIIPIYDKVELAVDTVDRALNFGVWFDEE